MAAGGAAPAVAGGDGGELDPGADAGCRGARYDSPGPEVEMVSRHDRAESSRARRRSRASHQKGGKPTLGSRRAAAALVSALGGTSGYVLGFETGSRRR